MLPRRNGNFLVGLLLCAVATIGACGARLQTSAATDGAMTKSGLPNEADASLGGDAVPACLVAASNYDQSCSVDSDCVRVDFGDYCKWLCRCGGDAINRASLPKFTADIAKTPLAQGQVPGVCSCGYFFGPCCRGGRCTAGPDCGADSGP